MNWEECHKGRSTPNCKGMTNQHEPGSPKAEDEGVVTEGWQALLMERPDPEEKREDGTEGGGPIAAQPRQVD